MKKIIIAIAVLISFQTLYGRNYYVSATGNDANTGLTTASPWLTITKVNSFSFASGDSILFKRGDSFYGSIIRRSNNIHYSAYGTGDKPVITGLTTVSTWIPTGGGKYYTTVVADSALNLVLLDGAPQGIARSPNIDAANGGYLSYLSVGTGVNASLTQIRNTIAGNYVGKKMALKQNDWSLNKVIITADNLDTLTFKIWFNESVGGSNTLSFGKSGYGYFFMDDTSYLDQAGEWTYQKATNRLYMFFTDNPNTHTVKVATVDTLVNLGAASNVSFTNMKFEGGKFTWHFLVTIF